MEKISFPKGFKVYLPLIALFLLLVFMMPRNPKFHYDYRKGSPWMYETLVTQFDFPVLKTDQQLQEEREKVGSTVIPYYKLDPDVLVESESALASMNFGEDEDLKSVTSAALSSIYSKGVLKAATETETAGQTAGGVIYVQKNRRAVKVPVSEVYTIDGAVEYLRSSLKASAAGRTVDSLFTALDLASLIVPDLVFDQQTTDLVQAESIDFISPTSGIVRTGQVIVSNGEIITAEVEQLLDSYRAEYDRSMGYSGPVALQWTGNILIAFCIVLVLFLAVYYCNYSIFDQYNKYLYLLMVFALAAITASIVARTD